MKMMSVIVKHSLYFSTCLRFYRDTKVAEKKEERRGKII
jgi:hypothetical protein